MVLVGWNMYLAPYFDLKKMDIPAVMILIVIARVIMNDPWTITLPKQDVE